ncbi:tRNA lysidine(34) synthetase TilS [Apilactobacillus apisilvae]|uniref:tRNA(Ile)-lysidine synthase n=1 Tax=Apilactobacillus apisilvae TaxID=2923364 RepID=A0ABY4PH89_9LACO|nr:tRNA lysidine(34) synthetase TilS [Apilactobacillus apisilvae]UQS85013.1 tRNA lysidine(34) synthetase TilS [Apilactobacillus apisilvae]
MQDGETLSTQFFNLITNNEWFSPLDKVVIGVSAGVDSMVLLYLMTHLPDNVRPKIIVAHINHKLRLQSEKEQSYIESFCKNNDLQCEIGIWEQKNHPTNGIENFARQYRYSFFKKIMTKYSANYLLTAHHLNDQSETILMKLIRGSYVKQISGIQRIRKFNNGFLLRPLLDFKKSELKQYAIEKHIKWFEDSTNQELDVQRNRVRHQIIPMMEKENPQVIKHLGNFSKQLNQIIDTNNDLIFRLLDQLKLPDGGYNLELFNGYSKNVKFSILETILNPINNPALANNNNMYNIIEILSADSKPQLKIDLSNEYQIYKSYNKFGLLNKNNNVNLLKSDNFVVPLNQWFTTLDGKSVLFTDKEIKSVDKYSRVSIFSLSADDFPLSVRLTDKKDKITLKSGGHQFAKRIFINKKVPNDLRKTAQTLLTAKGKVLSILGYSESTILNHSNKRYNLIIK